MSSTLRTWMPILLTFFTFGLQTSALSANKPTMFANNIRLPRTLEFLGVPTYPKLKKISIRGFEKANLYDVEFDGTRLKLKDNQYLGGIFDLKEILKTLQSHSPGHEMPKAILLKLGHAYCAPCIEWHRTYLKPLIDGEEKSLPAEQKLTSLLNGDVAILNVNVIPTSGSKASWVYPQIALNGETTPLSYTGVPAFFLVKFAADLSSFRVVMLEQPFDIAKEAGMKYRHDFKFPGVLDKALEVLSDDKAYGELTVEEFTIESAEPK